MKSIQISRNSAAINSITARVNLSNGIVLAPTHWSYFVLFLFHFKNGISWLLTLFLIRIWLVKKMTNSNWVIPQKSWDDEVSQKSWDDVQNSFSLKA